MSLWQTVELIVAPIREVGERLSALERNAIEGALEDLKILCDEEDHQDGIVADMMIELMQAIDDAGGPEGPPGGAQTTTTEAARDS